MEPLERLGPHDLRAVVIGYRDVLRTHREVINRLNVYPVPDGDTGTNMALTLESVVTELGAGMGTAEVCKAISHGSLMGARGNSGVILSQILRGIAEAFEREPRGDAAVVAEALAIGASAAYQAVLRPVEGTILTVARAAADAAGAAADTAPADTAPAGGPEAGASLRGVLEAARAAAADALERTRDQLEALRHAGVVDAGGAGYVLLLDAFLHVVDGRQLPEPVAAPAVFPEQSAAPVVPARDRPDDTAPDVSDLRYEVMYFLEAPDEMIPPFREVWACIGDSIVVVGGDGLWNCHIHTDDIGAAVEAGLDVGRPRQIRVTDLLEQVQEERWVREGALPSDDGGPAVGAVAGRTAVVAIVAGAGIGRLFRSVGVQAIVGGGQSMNPSVAQILAAVDACPATAVVILPNNANIIPVAEQVVTLTAKEARVVPTRSLAEGLAAAFAYDPEGAGEDNEKAMRSAVASVVTGEVTRAVRDAATGAGPVKEGEYLGVARDGIRIVAADVADAAIGLVECLLDVEHEILTVLEGEGATAAATRRVTEWVAEARPDVMVEVHHGGQPLYPYLFSIE